METRRRIIPSITTHSRTGHTWRHKVAEVKQLGLNEVGLFLTGLSDVERHECFCELEFLATHHRFSIPFVHAVASMREEEYRFLMDTFGTESFNLHPTWQYPLRYPLSDAIRSRVLIENAALDVSLTKNDLAGFAGLCIDLSHLEDSRRCYREVFDSVVSLSFSHHVAANHISAVMNTPQNSDGEVVYYQSHTDTKPEHFSYLAGLPCSTCAPLCAIELESPLKEQLALIPYLHDALEERDSCVLQTPLSL